MQAATKELRSQAAELKKQIDEAKKRKDDPESIKELQDQLDQLNKQIEMMGGLQSTLGNMSDKMIQDAVAQDENRGDWIPERDQKRIALVEGKKLEDADMIGFIKKIHEGVERLLKPENRQEANRIYAESISKVKNPERLADYINNVASNLMMAGLAEEALYIMGKVCIAYPNNTNNLNNYAAFLAMLGGEHAALPILQNLNKRYPNNSTILNNIGQAWFGLGHTNNANRFLDQALQQYPSHSQANITRSTTHKSEGNTDESIESLKRSMEEHYTPEKENRLDELGYKVKFVDIPFKLKASAEPLRIEEFMMSIPPYPFEGGLVAAQHREIWDDWRKRINDALLPIRAQKKILEVRVKAYTEALLRNPKLLEPYNNHVYKSASRKMTLLSAEATERMMTLVESGTSDTITRLRQAYMNALQTTEGCGARKQLATNFNSSANQLLQQWNAKWMAFNKDIVNWAARLSLYAFADRSLYLLNMEDIKEKFLMTLLGLQCEFEIGCLQVDPAAPQGRQLPDYDSLTCEYTDVIYIPPFTKMTFRCNIMTTEFDVDTKTGLKLKYRMEENLNAGRINQASMELSYERSIDGQLGPLAGELSAAAAVGVNIDSQGISEGYVKGSVAGSVEGTQVGQVEGTITWNAGRNGRPSTVGSQVNLSGISW